MKTTWDGDMESLLDVEAASNDDRYLVELATRMRKLRSLGTEEQTPQFVRRRLGKRRADVPRV